MKNIDNHVHELAKWIEQTYEINANEIIAKWEQLSGSGAGIAKKPGKAQHVNGDLDPTLCQHTFRVGNNAGMQCGVKPKDGPLCSSHKPKSRAASSNEKTVDIVGGALNPIYCNFEVSEGKQCGVKPKDGAMRCSIHRNGAPKIKTVPLVDGVVNPVFCNRKLSETTQCGVKPKAGNYCSSHREPVPTLKKSSKQTKKKSEPETDSESDRKSTPTLKKSSKQTKKSEPETDSETDSESDRSEARRKAKKKSAKEREPSSSEESEISESDSESDGEDELLKDAISRAGK